MNERSEKAFIQRRRARSGAGEMGLGSGQTDYRLTWKPDINPRPSSVAPHNLFTWIDLV